MARFDTAWYCPSRGYSIFFLNLTGTQAIEDSQVQEKASDSEDPPFSLAGLSRRQKTTFFLLATANLFSGCGFSLLAPFFPQEVCFNMSN